MWILLIKNWKRTNGSVMPKKEIPKSDFKKCIQHL